MNNYLIEGKHIYLRRIKKTDVGKKYLNWMNDKKITTYLESRFQKWSLKKLMQYVKDETQRKDYIFWVIILKEDNKHIGNIKLGPINHIHKYADLGFIIGDKRFWGKGYASEAVNLVVNFAFNNLRLHKITAGVYQNNLASLKVFQKNNFIIEGIKKKQYYFNNNYTDAYQLGIINE